MTDEKVSLYMGYRPSRQRVVREVDKLLKTENIVSLTIKDEGSKINYVKETGKKKDWIFPDIEETYQDNE